MTGEAGTGRRAGMSCCGFCRWSSLHTCTGYDCEEALEQARMFWENLQAENRIYEEEKKMQKVVRTAPTSKGYWYEGERLKYLQELLSQGYRVVMCNRIGDDLEYIVEKEDETV